MIITELGYKVEPAKDPTVAPPQKKREPWKAPVPKDAPEFFKKAIERAQREGKPLIIDFWAPSCGPCLRLKTVTLMDPKVAKALGAAVLIYVDLDEHPTLAESYGVISIPDVFLVNRKGLVVDRLKEFEAPKPFLSRLNRLIEPPKDDKPKDGKKDPPRDGDRDEHGALPGRTLEREPEPR